MLPDGFHPKQYGLVTFFPCLLLDAAWLNSCSHAKYHYSAVHLVGMKTLSHLCLQGTGNTALLHPILWHCLTLTDLPE